MTKQQRWAQQNPDKRRQHRTNWEQRNPERVREMRDRYNERRRLKRQEQRRYRKKYTDMPRSRKTQQPAQPPQGTTQELSPYIQEMRRSVGYDETKAREMQEQAAALHQWSQSGVRSSRRLREMQI